jgi:hypothetical protein
MGPDPDARTHKGQPGTPLNWSRPGCLRCDAETARDLLVDLTDIEFIDAVGEDVLSFFGRFGAEFIVPTSYTLDVYERLNLPVVPAGNSHQNTSGISATNDGQCHPGAPDPEKKKI